MPTRSPIDGAPALEPIEFSAQAATYSWRMIIPDLPSRAEASSRTDRPSKASRGGKPVPTTPIMRKTELCETRRPGLC